MMDCPRTLVLGWDWDGTTLWRGAFPVNACKLYGLPVEWALLSDGLNISHPDIERKVAAAEVIVLVRGFFYLEFAAGRDAWFARRRAAGQTVIWEVDDDLLSGDYRAHVGEAFPARLAADLDARHAAQLAMLDVVDALTVTTPALAAHMATYTAKPIAVVPNLLAWEWWREQFRAAPRTVPAPAIGWVGGTRSPADFAPMLAAWGAIHRRYPHIHFRIAGSCPVDLAAVIAPSKLHVALWVRADFSPRQWRDVDIACLPLADRPFNHCKSPLKALEAGAAGAAVVASPTIYRDVLTPGATGLIAETAADWEAALAALLEDKRTRKALAARWQGQVRAQYALEDGWSAWPAAWAALRLACAPVSVA